MGHHSVYGGSLRTNTTRTSDQLRSAALWPRQCLNGPIESINEWGFRTWPVKGGTDARNLRATPTPPRLTPFTNPGPATTPSSSHQLSNPFR